MYLIHCYVLKVVSYCATTGFFSSLPVTLAALMLPPALYLSWPIATLSKAMPSWLGFVEEGAAPRTLGYGEWQQLGEVWVVAVADRKREVVSKMKGIFIYNNILILQYFTEIS
ncbi:hypothetical protein FGO68_gene701 [Halteria grandinella]|uniref:Uncharacterized protein n=1 Tax=Halteria grandinella TaxID=5974 RepID=A0A8J8P8R2_HALGN|nr:hypothetical protein FGO68_gene701 [Halteria grandinella]